MYLHGSPKASRLSLSASSVSFSYLSSATLAVQLSLSVEARLRLPTKIPLSVYPYLLSEDAEFIPDSWDECTMEVLI
jgi:hypothetical protein